MPLFGLILKSRWSLDSLIEQSEAMTQSYPIIL